ncbi:hypothetical protein ACL03H_02915 [Saccharopolyspora sp. MS10]|uniref:hypothetical protein n=1 Tax=Saccharopolyspora sp. MS10 TaxID=3385973 RepID=UPI0039A37294
MEPLAGSGAGVLLCAPLRCEAAALRGASEASVLRTGLGPWRSARRGAGVELGDRVLVVAGLGGGVGATGTGTVVVAEEVRDEAGAVPLPGAAGLAARLRAAGFPVLLGPVASADHVVRGPERARLAEAGAVAVDMESIALARSTTGRLRAVVRVVVDTAAAPLVHPRTPDRGARALLRLRAIAPHLTSWAAELSPERCRPGRSPSVRNSSKCWR